jgi:hypothetical protein
MALSESVGVSLARSVGASEFILCAQAGRVTSKLRTNSLAGILTARNGRQLYVPPGVAHGFQTLEPETSVGYMMSVFHAPEAATCVRYDDPAFGIHWPLPFAAISECDQHWPDFDPEQGGLQPALFAARAATGGYRLGDCGINGWPARGIDE